jgi:hypothetical protein
MYYVIQRHNGDPKKHYIAYTVPKYISSDNSKNIIFEFKHEGQIKRKWTSKEEIILLTDNKELFYATLQKLETLKNAHLEEINKAEEKLEHEITRMLAAMQNEFDTIKNIK